MIGFEKANLWIFPNDGVGKGDLIGIAENLKITEVLATQCQTQDQISELEKYDEISIHTDRAESLNWKHLARAWQRSLCSE